MCVELCLDFVCFLPFPILKRVNIKVDLLSSLPERMDFLLSDCYEKEALLYLSQSTMNQGFGWLMPPVKGVRSKCGPMRSRRSLPSLRLLSSNRTAC